MKKDILLEIHIDTDQKEEGSVLQTHGLLRFLKRIIITGEHLDVGSLKSDDPKVVEAKLLHELGHLVSEIISSPVAVADPRWGISLNDAPTDDDKLRNLEQRTLNSELEAWDNADKMLGSKLDKQYLAVRKACIDTYLEGRSEKDRREIIKDTKEQVAQIEDLREIFKGTPLEPMIDHILQAA